jgi:hypothetical protein
MIVTKIAFPAQGRAFAERAPWDEAGGCVLTNAPVAIRYL